jgi:hypothetical protein
MEDTQGNKDNILDHPKRLLVGGAVIGIGGFILYKLIKKIIAGAQKSSTEKLADDSPEVRQAMALRSAVNPSGASWMKSFDTTNVSAVFETAKQIKNLDEVASSYKKLYQDDLLLDLQKELSTTDYQKFLTLVSANPAKSGGSAPVTFAAKSQLVVAKTDVYLRTSPDASYHGAVYEFASKNKNIIRKAKPGEFLGYATGKQSFDVKNNVKFIEVGYLVKKEDLPASLKAYAGKKYTYWVSSSSSYVDIFPYYKNMWDKYPATQKETSYKKPLDYYGAVAGISNKMIVTIRPTKVLDEAFKKPLAVPPQTLLGEYQGSLDTGKTRYFKFRTVDKTLRWVLSQDVRIM